MSRFLSVLEKAKLVCWFEETHSLAMAARRFRAEFGKEPPKLESIKKWHAQFMETGNVASEGASVSSPLATRYSTVSRFYEPRLMKTFNETGF
ncbi:hypothetical protein FO519_005943 [Halicephalobus sp. NKZ332]|nr:hypothetical protein FO519_005943 [Halicephalobus sp. NKZ332]